MSFIRNCWYVAGLDDQLVAGQMQAITICDEPILFYRTAAGEVIALADRCCHRFAPLSKGRLEDGCNVRCMYHGLKFDPKGECVEIPGQDVIPPGARVRSYAVATRFGWIWVWMGDRASADLSLLPEFRHADVPAMLYRHGHLDYAVHYELINDNLTDFSHLAFLHAESFKASEAWAHLRPSVKLLERGIRVTRWFGPDQLPLKADAQGRERLPKEAPVMAMYQSYDYLAPGILLMASSFHAPELMPQDRSTGPTSEPRGVRVDMQAVTPMTERSTRYFFTTATSAEGGEALADRTKLVTEMAFAEDRVMIEAQQQRMDQHARQGVAIRADVGPVQFRSVIRRLLKAEGATDAASLGLDSPSRMGN